MLQVGHPCGLCNRLDVITTGYLFARERGEKDLEVIWPVNSQMPASFTVIFFTALPNGRVVECNLDPRAWRDHRAWRDFHSLIGSLPPNYRDSDFYTEMLARLSSECAVPQVQADVSAFAEEHFGDASRSGCADSPAFRSTPRLEPRVVVQELSSDNIPSTIQRTHLPQI